MTIKVVQRGARMAGFRAPRRILADPAPDLVGLHAARAGRR